MLTATSGLTGRYISRRLNFALVAAAHRHCPEYPLRPAWGNVLPGKALVSVAPNEQDWAPGTGGSCGLRRQLLNQRPQQQVARIVAIAPPGPPLEPRVWRGAESCRCYSGTHIGAGRGVGCSRRNDGDDNVSVRDRLRGENGERLARLSTFV